MTGYDFCFSDASVINVDDTAYKQIAFRLLLSASIPNAVHITCLAHAMNLLSEAKQEPLVMVNEFMQWFHKQFHLAGRREAAYLSYLKSVIPDWSTDPVAIRWR